MVRIPRSIVGDMVYHVLNRANGRETIFKEEKDNHFLQACRYIERNPLRANLIQRAEDWRWSSLWIRQYGTDKQKALLSPWPVDEPSPYLQRVNENLDNKEEKLDRIRNSIKRGRPFVNDSWVRKVADKLGLNSTLNPRGRPGVRPKKGT